MVKLVIEPMLAKYDPSKLGDPNYTAEEKIDGTRAIIHKKGNNVTMVGRREKNDFASKFPEIVEEIRKLAPEEVILDSELAFFKGNLSVFLTALATEDTKEEKGYEARAIVFDIMYVKMYSEEEDDVLEVDTTVLPIEERRELLHLVIPDGLRHVKINKVYEDASKHRKVFEQIVERGGEGLVLKLRGSPYVPKSRSYWVKVKRRDTADCIICGVTHGEGAREPYFGSLILAQYHKGKLIHVGNAGTGFTDEMLATVYKRIKKLPKAKNPCCYEDKDAKCFVEPLMVAEVYFERRLKSLKFRSPVFKMIREDKPPEECVINGV